MKLKPGRYETLMLRVLAEQKNPQKDFAEYLKKIGVQEEQIGKMPEEEQNDYLQS